MKIKNYLDKFSILNSQLSTPKGFTLIEILIAIAMIGVLSTVGLLTLNPLEQIKKGRDAQRKYDLLQIRNALDTYNSDNNLYPASSIEHKIIDGTQNDKEIGWGASWQPYILKLPKDPLSPQQNYYYVSEDKTSYTVYARLERSNDPQIIPGSESSLYNFAISSTNIAVALLPTPTPTPTPIPTSTPTPTPGLKYVFVTSAAYNGNLGGLAGADAKCQSLADAPTSVSVVKNKIWKAWLSTATENAIDRIINGIYTRVDGGLIANDKTDLIDWTKPKLIDKDEKSNIVNGPLVFTGTLKNGLIDTPNTCSDWTTSGCGPIGREGGTDNPFFGWWTERGVSSCCGNFRLYCFEQ